MFSGCPYESGESDSPVYINFAEGNDNSLSKLKTSSMSENNFLTSQVESCDIQTCHRTISIQPDIT